MGYYQHSSPGGQPIFAIGAQMARNGRYILVLPSTAALFESSVGKFKRPVLQGQRDLGDLADPTVSTRFAMAYLRDILVRKPNIKDALVEYNGGPAGRQLHYYRMVMGAYVETLERPELRCRYQPAPKRPAVLALLNRA